MTKPYPWFYAVNDRPVVIVATPSGGSDCLVFDFVSGNLIPDRSYMSEVAPGSGRDVDALTQSEFARLVAERRVDVLHIWAERLCSAKSGSAEDLLQAIGASMKPAPLGASEIRVRGDEVSLANVELELPPGTIAKRELDARFGEGRKLPRTGPYASHTFVYFVEVEGAPHSCSVFASFAEAPNENTTLKSVMLKLENAQKS